METVKKTKMAPGSFLKRRAVSLLGFLPSLFNRSSEAFDVSPANAGVQCRRCSWIPAFTPSFTVGQVAGKTTGYRLLMPLLFLTTCFLLPVTSPAADLFPGYGSAKSALSAGFDVYAPPLLISTPSYPANNSYINLARPSFAWVGVSTPMAASIGAQGQYKVDYSIDPDFLSGVVTLSTPIVTATNAFTADGLVTPASNLSDNTTYYWRVKVYDGTSLVSGDWSQVYSFKIDLTVPSASDYKVISSTSGLLSQDQWINLTAGVTVQMKARDEQTGLAVSTSALWGDGGNSNWSDLTGGFSIKYTTNAGANWQEGTGWSVSGNSTVGSMAVLAVYRGKLYGGGYNGSVAVFSGTSWTPAFTATGTHVQSFAVYRDKLYVGLHNGTVGVYDAQTDTYAQDTNNGNPVNSLGTQVTALAVYNDKLYAGAGVTSAQVAVFDGTSWKASNKGNPVTATATGVYSFAVYNGKLYAAVAGTGEVAIFNGVNWVNGGVVEYPWGSVRSLCVYNGKLYAGTYNNRVFAMTGSSWVEATTSRMTGVIESLTAYNGKLYAGIYDSYMHVFDGTSWAATNNGNPVTAGWYGGAVAVYNGRLYMGNNAGSNVSIMNQLATTLTGADGTTAEQTLSASGLNLVQSTNSVVCNGSYPCGATNQVVFSASDMAGNVRTYGPYSVLVDTTPPPVPTLSAPADGAVFAISSIPVSWTAVTDGGSGLAGYELQLSAASDFNPVTYSSFTANLSLVLNDVPYLNYWRVRSRDNSNNYSAFTSYRSFYVDASSPVITNNQVSPTEWYSADPGAVFNVDFADLISGLTTAQYRITSAAAGGGTVLKGWTDIYSNPAGAAAYTDNWAVNFAVLNQGLNYVSVRAFDKVALSETVTDAFVIRKDTDTPHFIDNQAGDNTWRGTAGTAYNIDFTDLGAGVTTAQYMITSQTAGNGTVLKDWTDIYSNPTGGAAYTDNWTLDFTALQEASTNYVSVRAYDLLEKTTTYYDAFYVLKDTTSPTIIDNQPNDVWRTVNPGAIYDVDFADAGGSKLSYAVYSISTSPVLADGTVKAWTNIAVSISSNGYETNWQLDFAAERAGTNYVSVRVYDYAGNYTQQNDIFSVIKDTAGPVITDNQTGDAVWRAEAGTLYDVDFADPLTGFTTAQYRITSLAAGGGTVLKDWTDIYSNAAGTAAYTTDWSVDFAALAQITTNYVSVRAYDFLGNSTTRNDVFYVLKDTTPPTITNNQANDIWRYTDPGAIYNTDFSDTGGSKLNRAQYSISTGRDFADGNVKGWTDIAISISSNGYTANWAVDFAAEPAGTSYVSVRTYDNAGNNTQQTDIFTVRKDTTAPVITNNQSGDDAWRTAAGTLYDVDFADDLSGLATAQYKVTSLPAGAGTVIKNWTDIYSNPSGAAAYTDNWPLDFAGLQEWATGYVSVRAYDLAAKPTVSTDVFHVLKDTTPPSIALTSFRVSSVTLSLAALGSDIRSGFKDYYFEISPVANFSADVLSAGYSASTSAVFADMLEATTYYARVKARDIADNESAYTVTAATRTRGFVHISGTNLAPANAMQGSNVVMMTLDMVINSVNPATLQRIDLTRTGTTSASDVAAVKIYRDTNGNGLLDGDEPLFGSAGFSGVNTTVTMTPPLPVTSTQVKLLVVYNFAAEATIGKTAGVTITSADKLVFADPYQTVGVFPMTSDASTIQDGNNNLYITATSLVSGAAPPGTANVPIIKLVMNTNVGTSTIERLNALLAGTVASNNVSAVKIYRDANSNAQFDLASDTLLTSGSDAFLEYSSTITLTASAANRTVGSVPVYMFVVVDVAAGTPEGSNFTVSIPTSSAFALTNSGDKPLMTPASFTSGRVVVQTSNSANVLLQSLVPAEMMQGGVYAVAMASVSVNLGVADLNRVTVNKAGSAVDNDIKAAWIYRDTMMDGGDFNINFDLPLGSAAFSGGIAVIDIATETISASATTQLFVVYEISPTAIENHTVGAGFTNPDYFRMSNSNTIVSGSFPFTTATAPIKLTVNPLKIIAAQNVTIGELFQGTTNNLMLRLDLKSELNPVSWTSIKVISTGTLPDNMIDAVKVYRDANDDDKLTIGVDELVTEGSDVFINHEVRMLFIPPQSVTAEGASYFVTLDISPDAAQGYTTGIVISSTNFLTVNSPSIISTASATAPYEAGPVTIKQYNNTIYVSTVNIMSALGDYPGASDVPIFKLTLNTDISTAKLQSMKFTKVGTLTGAEVKAVKIYYDIANIGSFNRANISAYSLITTSTVTFGGDDTVTLGISTATGGLDIVRAGRSCFVVMDLQPSAVIGRYITMRVPDSTYIAVSTPNSMAPVSFSSPPLYVRAPPQTLSVAFENKLSTYVIQGQLSVLVASFTVSASSYSISMSRINMTRGGTGFDSDIASIRLYRDDGTHTWDGSAKTPIASGVISGGLISFTPETVETIQYPNRYLYYIVADISETAAYGRSLAIDIPSVGYFTVNDPHSVASAGFPFYSQRAMIQPTIDNLIVAGIDSAPSLIQGGPDKVIGRLRVHTDLHSALISSIRFERSGTTPDADIYRIRLYKDDGNLALNSGDQLVGTLNSLSSGIGVMVISPPQTISTADTDYLVTVAISTLATIDTSFSLRVAPEVVAPDAVTITGSTIIFTMAGVIADKPDTIYSSFSDIASQSLYVGMADSQIAKLSFWADNDMAYLTELKLNFSGSAGPSDIPTVKLYRDTNASGYFEAAYDVLAATAAIVSGESYIYLPDSGDAITVSTRAYFVVADISSSAIIDRTVTLEISNENSVYLAGTDIVTPFPTRTTKLSTIRDPRVPTPPVISVYRVDGRLFSETDEAFNAYRTLLQFRWHSTTLQGSIEQAYYYIGASPADGSTPAGSWTTAGSSGEVSIRGLNMLNNGVYNISVRVKNSEGAYYSDIVSKRFIVDTVVPALPPGAAYTSSEGGDILLNWAPATSGVSGLEYYAVEERRGNSPLWVIVSTTTDLFLPITIGGSHPSDLARSPGSYFYRVYPVSNAGLAGTPSDPLAVNINLEQLATISEASIYPNPFDSRKQSCTIIFTLNTASAIEVSIYDVFGGKVRDIKTAGIVGVNMVYWDGSAASGSKVSKGVYLCVIKAAGAVKVLKAAVRH